MTDDQRKEFDEWLGLDERNQNYLSDYRMLIT